MAVTTLVVGTPTCSRLQAWSAPGTMKPPRTYWPQASGLKSCARKEADRLSGVGDCIFLWPAGRLFGRASDLPHLELMHCGERSPHLFTSRRSELSPERVTCPAVPGAPSTGTDGAALHRAAPACGRKVTVIDFLQPWPCGYSQRELIGLKPRSSEQEEGRSWRSHSRPQARHSAPN